MEPVPNRAPGFSNPHDALRHHVSGAVERGEKTPIVGQPDPNTSRHEIQYRKGKGGWQTLRSYEGNGLKAARDYSALNIGRGGRKRFVVDGNVVHTTTYNPLGE